MTSEAYPWGRACRALPPFGRAILLSCATSPADLFESKTRQRPLVVVRSAVVEHLAVAMASELVAVAMVAQWLEE